MNSERYRNEFHSASSKDRTTDSGSRCESVPPMSESSSPQPALGAAIKALRTEKEMRQQTLAEGAGITVAHLSKIERGLGNPTWATVVAVAEALDVSIAALAKATEKHK